MNQKAELHILDFVGLFAMVFHILLSLADGEQHGYGIMQEVLERTGGKVRVVRLLGDR